MSKMNNKELEELFSKFSITELDDMNRVLENVKDYDVEETIRIKDEVYNRKLKEAYNNFEVPVKTNNSLINKDYDVLTDIEMNYLYLLVNDASFFLSTIREYEEEYRNINEEFDSSFYPIDYVNELELILYNTMINRTDHKKNVLKLK